MLVFNKSAVNFEVQVKGYDPNTPGLSKQKNHAASETQTYRRYVE